ncbi:hypothetical protein niasHT_004182 [Heterodera trifolii]|uniref:Uncharacterized protein n=1 Tax=Heterodera trifolii TaxID=157864 RepID=A0ABD2LQ18_9BILA
MIHLFLLKCLVRSQEICVPMDRRHQSADHRQLIKECAEMEEQISQLYERRIKQEKQLAEKDEIIKRLESDLY